MPLDPLKISELAETTELAPDDDIVVNDADADNGAVDTRRSSVRTLTGHISSEISAPGEPNGFRDAASTSLLSWDEPSRTLTISPTGVSYDIWSDGVRFEKTAPESIQIADVEGPHFVYFDGDGNLAEVATFDIDIILRYCFVAVLYWDADNKRVVPNVINEKHSASMDAATHAYLHNTQGARYGKGLNVAVEQVDGSGDDPADARFAVSSGEFWDEDIRHTALAHSFTDNIPVLYRDGPDGDWRMLGENTPYPVITTGSGRAAWNEWTGVAWKLTEVNNNDFVHVHIFALPGISQAAAGFVAILGQSERNTLGQARADALTEIRRIQLDGKPSEEMLPIATLILQSSDGYANLVKSRVRSTDSGGDFENWLENPPHGVG